MDIAIYPKNGHKEKLQKWYFGKITVSNVDADSISWLMHPFTQLTEKTQKYYKKNGFMSWKYANFAQPEIIPEIGKPPRHPPKSSWLLMPIFAFLILLLPATVLFYAWYIYCPINIDGLFILDATGEKSVAKVASGLLFQINLAAVAFLLTLHWIYLDLFTFLKCFSVLSIFLISFGWFHFRFISHDRVLAIYQARQAALQ
jgi:Oligosaccharyltransferase subunit Ribophorin II